MTEEELQQIVLRMKSVAVIGMKGQKDSHLPAYLIPQAVQTYGLRVIPVNPMIRSSLGEKAYPSIAKVDEPFDTINIFRRSEFIEPIADEILGLPKEKYPQTVWMQSGIQNQAAVSKLTKTGIDVVQDRCLAVYVARYRREKLT